ncbi:prostaglandin E synthase [Nematostella vectensis]|uniref:prostaglandin E synthase n=1 Tax=Nematostella vectensis TaxID=45351 RepID=UPI00207737DD|nr:prostaglandin E synthase [Nematostella vectensis]
MAVENLLTFDNRVFALFAVCTAALILKMFFVVYLLGKSRVKHQVLSSPEDYEGKTDGKVKSHPDVDRAIRIQHNDLENIPAFIFLALLYVLTDPREVSALIVFAVFTFSRFMHTGLYWMAAPHGVRAIFFIIGTLANLFLIVQILWTGVHALM